MAVGYRPDGTEVVGGGWHLYPEAAPASLWATPTEYAVFVIDVMRSYGDGSGIALDQESARLLPDLGDAVVVMTNGDSGVALDANVIDAVARELGWPWVGRSTPLWAVLIGLALPTDVVTMATESIGRRVRQ